MNDGLYLYCIVPPGHEPPPELRGLDDGVVRLVVAASVCVWASPCGAPPRPSIERVERHNAVVEAAMTSMVTPVPLRFGQYVADADELASRAAERAADWTAALEDLAGCREYGVRVVDPALAATARDVRPVAVTSGRAYLAGLARNADEAALRQRDADRLAQALRDRVGSLIVRERVEALRTARGVASIAHLVRRGDEAAYRRTVEEAAASMPELRFMTSGPWPPYSFAE